MLKKLARPFQIKTRLEAWFVIYAIALGAVLRGQAYMTQYPGWIGGLFFLACIMVVFIAGAKLLDAVAKKPALAKLSAAPVQTPRRRDGTWRRHDGTRARRRVTNDRRRTVSPRQF